jgi:hypothetical protein
MAEMKTLSYEFSKVMASRLEEKDAQVQAMEKLAGEIREEEEEDDLPPRGFVDPRARFPNRAPGETFPPRKKEEPEPDEPPLNPDEVEIRFEDYYDEDKQIQVIMDLVDNELSEPYNIFTYRYFVNNWPKLTFLAWHGDKCVGVIICKVRPAPPSFIAISPIFTRLTVHPAALPAAAGPSQERKLQGVHRHARGREAVPQARARARARATVPGCHATRARARVRPRGGTQQRGRASTLRLPRVHQGQAAGEVLPDGQRRVPHEAAVQAAVRLARRDGTDG